LGETSYPVSSFISLAAASTEVSPGSTLPPIIPNFVGSFFLETAKEIAENEMRERGGKYGIQIIAFREDNNEQEIVFEIESPYKNKVNIPTYNA
jgi:hypothetical protein